jgi:hypothetical protein
MLSLPRATTIVATTLAVGCTSVGHTLTMCHTRRWTRVMRAVVSTTAHSLRTAQHLLLLLLLLLLAPLVLLLPQPVLLL